MIANLPADGESLSHSGPDIRLDAMERSVFDELRPRLFGIAYRMLSVRADAEDVVQDAWLRWHQTDRSSLHSEEAWLVTVVTRLSIDRLRAVQLERSSYVGEWLAEPIVQAHDETPESLVERANELSLAILYVLERLGPEERAAFLLRKAFDYEHGEIAGILGKSELAVRQMVHRASARLRLERPRFVVSPQQHKTVLQRFVAALNTGERSAIRSLLADDVEAIGDGGGQVPAATRGTLRGGDVLAGLYLAHFRRLGDRLSYEVATINGEPGILRFTDGRLDAAQALVTDGERIVAMYAVLNPEKLARISFS